MKETILVAGQEGFNETMVNRFSPASYEFITKDLNASREQGKKELNQLSKPIHHASVVFISSEPNLFPVAEMALKNSKHVVLFGVQQCSCPQLKQLLDLSIESQSMLVNGDSMLFNPIIYPHRTEFLTTEMTTLHSNQFGKFLSRQSIFQSIELLLSTNSSPIKNTSTKAVVLEDSQINVLHTRLEFENGALAVLEMANCKPSTSFELETSGTGIWLSLDLLSFNGKKHQFNSDGKMKPSMPVVGTERNAMMNLMNFIHQELPAKINPHQQFQHSIQTAEVLLKMEEQLRREVPNFVFFHES